MTAKADSRLPAPLTPGPRAGKFVGFCHRAGACSLLCLALELGEGQFGCLVLPSPAVHRAHLSRVQRRSHPRGIQFPE